MTKLYILTLTWNGLSKLKRLYPTLINSVNDISYKWYIKDNNSVDNSISYLNEQNNSNIIPIKWKDNLQNYSQGNNFLFREAAPKESDYILLLNNDIIFNDATSIKRMISIMDNDPDVGVVGAKLNYTNTNKLQCAGIIFSQKYAMLPFHFRPNEKEDNNARKNREFQAVTGACLLTKAAYYADVFTNKDGLKGLDQNYIWMFEDIDMNIHIKHNLKKKIVYCGETNIYHEESATLKQNPQNRLFQQHNVNLFRQKWGNIIQEDHSKYLKDPNYMLYKGKSK
jgi:GT2 family glycosyltransferase